MDPGEKIFGRGETLNDFFEKYRGFVVRGLNRHNISEGYLIVKKVFRLREEDDRSLLIQQGLGYLDHRTTPYGNIYIKKKSKKIVFAALDKKELTEKEIEALKAHKLLFLADLNKAMEPKCNNIFSRLDLRMLINLEKKITNNRKVVPRMSLQDTQRLAADTVEEAIINGATHIAVDGDPVYMMWVALLATGLFVYDSSRGVRINENGKCYVHNQKYAPIQCVAPTKHPTKHPSKLWRDMVFNRYC